MSVTSSELGPLTIAAPAGASAPSLEEGDVDAAFRRAHGIPPHGDTSAPDSEWGFPLPPADHPEAKKFARAVLSRAHQNGNFKADDVAKQVAKARSILGEKPDGKRESARGFYAPLRLTLREADANKGTARVIIIREGPGNLGDRHYYTAAALNDSVNRRLWESAQCYTDHPTPTEDREIPERSVKNLAGWFSDAQVIEYNDPERGACKAVEATFHPQVGREDVIGMLRTCVEYAKAFPQQAYIGLSINACGDSSPASINGEQWNQVDRFTEVISVDLVTRAGAGGKMIAFRESYKVAKTLKKLDPAQIKEAVLADIASAKKRFKEDAAISLTPEQDKALDAALGIVDGGKLDQLIDQAVGVSPTDDENDAPTEESQTPMETDKEKKERETREAAEKEREKREAAAALDEAALAPFKGKTQDEVLALHKKANPDNYAESDEDREKREAREKREGADGETAEEKEKREKRESADARAATAERQLKEHRVDAALVSQNVPDGYRPRLKRELMERATISTATDIGSYVGEFAQAYIKPHESHGMTFRESAGGGEPTKLNITFKPQSSYGE